MANLARTLRMDPSHDHLTAADPNLYVSAELVIQNGRLKGTARPLSQPLTLIGRSADCDLRLNVEGIHPLHCLLAQTPDGLMLRDLSGDGTVLVNGESASLWNVKDGDVLAVGPFQFRVRLLGAPLTEQLAQSRRQQALEKDALRVQAAAVAAQQAALLEEEARLQQRQAALAQQEEQLATHLEEKRKRLLELRDQIKEAHSTLKDHKAKYGAQFNEGKREVEAGRREVTDGRRQVVEERRRLRQLLRRMRLRYHRQWAGERESISGREAEVARQLQEIEQERSRLERESASVLQARLQLNADVELARRQLKEEWTSLRHEELHFDDFQSRQSAELDALRRDVDQRELALSEVEQELEEQRHDWQEVRQEVEKEVEGLEVRARNFRRQIGDLQGELAQLQSAVVAVAAPEASPPAAANAPSNLPVPAAPPVVLAEVVDDGSQTRVALLERIAGELADQRSHLAEQWERLLLVQQRWQQHYQSLVRELESAGRHMLEREHLIQTREHALESAEERMRQRHQESIHLQRQLEAWQTRMTARETSWAAERDRLLAALHARTQLAERRLAEVRLLHERWTKRRRREIAWLSAERASSEKLRKECADLRADWLKQLATLEEEQRGLAERSLAMEQYQQEVMGQAANPASAERRLQRLRIRWASHLVESQKALQAERQKLEADAGDLQERHGRFQKQLVRLNQREEELAERLRKWEEDRLRVGDELAHIRQDLEVTQSHRDRFEKQVIDLRDEVERIARLLIDETQPILTLPHQNEPPAQAA